MTLTRAQDATLPDTRHSSAGTAKPSARSVRRRLLGLVVGPLAAVALYLAMPAGLDVWPRLTAAAAVLMAVWWITEAIPIPATSLLPLVIFPVLVPAAEAGGERLPFNSVGAHYGNNIIFLFMGGFMLALAMQRWQLHRRIALRTLSLTGSRTTNLVAGFMVATGFLSMWVSNTATAVMMLPIALSVLTLVGRIAKDTSDGGGQATASSDDEPARAATSSNFGTALLLGTAYAASIGSLGTIIGTPPNALLVGHIYTTYRYKIGFGQWMLVGVPVAIVMMVVAWFLLTHVLFRPEMREIPGGAALIRDELRALGPMTRAEQRVLAVFVAAASAWVVLPLVSEHLLGLEEPVISDAGIAMVVALLLFTLPSGDRKGVRLLDWEWAVKLPWGVLLLFGGGLALSAQFSASGLSEWLGTHATGLAGVPLWLLVGVVSLVIIFLTEITSNTATAATFLPVASGVAIGIGTDALMLAVPVALAASAAFMMPVATPPNAIVYGSGRVTIGQMVRGGLWLNLIGVVVITGVSMTLLRWVFGLAF